jgi:predicted ABC-type ATPase
VKGGNKVSEDAVKDEIMRLLNLEFTKGQPVTKERLATVYENACKQFGRTISEEEKNIMIDAVVQTWTEY